MRWLRASDAASFLKEKKIEPSNRIAASGPLPPSSAHGIPEECQKSISPAFRAAVIERATCLPTEKAGRSVACLPKVRTKLPEVANQKCGAGVSVFIMTYNEELNLARCLDSLRWSNDVVVLDSFSDDGTREIAASYDNVRVFCREFDDYASTRNHGLRNIRYQNPWLLMVDADEVVEPALALELRRVASQGARVTTEVFLMRRKVYFGNRWIRHNVEYGVWYGRFMRPSGVRFEGIVHEKPLFTGPYALLDGALEHYPFTKGVEDWLSRRRRYARLEAQRAAPLEFRPRDLFSASVIVRRAAIKALYVRLPARWLVYLVYNIVLKLAFLDGLQGMRYLFWETYSLVLAAKDSKEHAIA